MRKNTLAGLLGGIALLFSLLAVTAGPALGDNYPAYPSEKGPLDIGIVDPVPCGGPITGSVSGGTAPYTVTVAIGNGVLSTTLAASGAYAFPITAAIAPPGATTYTYSVVDAVGATASGSHSATISYSCGTSGGGSTGGGGTTGGGTTGGGTTGGGTTVVTTTTTTGGTTTTATNFGFNNAGIPSQPSLAITGTDADLLGFIATGLIALGALAMGTRRKLLQGALQD